MNPVDPKTNQQWNAVKAIACGSLLLGNTVLLVGQAQAELQLLTHLESERSFWPSILIWSIGSLLFGMLAWGFARWSLVWLDETFPNKAKLFRQLCDAHTLSSHDRQFLHQMSEKLELDNPCRLFLETAAWDRYATNEPADSKQVDALRKRILSGT